MSWVKYASACPRSWKEGLHACVSGCFRHGVRGSPTNARDKIDACQGLIHIVGHAYGAEPPTHEPEFGRVSYTQFEFHYARKKKKKTWLLFADHGCSRDRSLDLWTYRMIRRTPILPAIRPNAVTCSSPTVVN